MFKQTLYFIAAGSLMIGCAVDDGVAIEPSGDLGVITSALCTDVGVPHHSAPLGPSWGDTVSATSADGSYGSPSCPGRFVLEAKMVNDRDVYMAAGVPSSYPLGKAACLATTVTSKAYGAKLKLNPFPQPPSTVWIDIESEKSVTGTWVTVSPYLSYCSLINDPVTFEASGYVAVRVAAKAERAGVPIPVTAEVIGY